MHNNAGFNEKRMTQGSPNIEARVLRDIRSKRDANKRSGKISRHTDYASRDPLDGA